MLRVGLRTDERRSTIVKLLSALGELSVEELSGRLGVTESTVRRDLQRLASDGRIMRSFGAAVANRMSLAEPSLAERTATARVEKDAIGAWCAAQVRDGETIVLDAGTTTGRIAAHLRDRSGITVVTSGLTALAELAHAEGVQVVVLGGRLRHLSQGLVGPLTDMSLSAFTFDRAFLGADGLRADLGICEAEMEQTRTKELMASRAAHVYVVADCAKLGASPFNAWARVPKYTLVTDDNARDDVLEPFRANRDIDVVLVSPDDLHMPQRSPRAVS